MKHYFAGYRGSPDNKTQELCITVRCEKPDDMRAIAAALSDVRWTEGVMARKPSIDIPSAVSR